ncbi:hypothetical protein WMY93_025632 [Mugilogobius chulae]|uniref:Uncharacterized protein n=1 Tax=Mugilogobius chulae TaxID=88201 RepID=A0AAW0MZX8_9GOBI
MLLLPVLLALLASLFGGLYFLAVGRRRRPGEPPLDKGLIPWLGHALDFQRDPFRLLQKMKEKHGDVFTIQLAGQYVTFLQDPFSFEALLKQRSDIIEFDDTDMSETVFGYEETQQALSQGGVSHSTIEKVLFAFLFAAQANVPSTAFWLLLHLMKDPEAMNALRGEAEKVVKESGDEVCPGGPLIRVTYDMLKKTPLLDSAVEEALRLSAGIYVNRQARHDMTLKMTDGRELLLRKNDQLCTNVFLAIHTDPEVHPEPYTFKYDRFLNPDGTKKKDFYKSGRRVKYYNAPFGGGLSMCPGRFFALNELKQMVFHMLVYFDFELLNPDEKMPSFRVDQFGLGTSHPEREIHFRYRLKSLK